MFAQILFCEVKKEMHKNLKSEGKPEKVHFLQMVIECRTLNIFIEIWRRINWVSQFKRSGSNDKTSNTVAKSYIKRKIKKMFFAEQMKSEWISVGIYLFFVKLNNTKNKSYKTKSRSILLLTGLTMFINE